MKFLHDRADYASNALALLATVALFGLVAPSLHMAAEPRPPEPLQTVDISLEAAPVEPAPAAPPPPSPPQPAEPPPPAPPPPEPPPPPPPPEPPPPPDAPPPVIPPPPPPPPVVEPPKPQPPKPLPPKPAPPRPVPANPSPAAAPSQAVAAPGPTQPAAQPKPPAAPSSAGVEDAYVGRLRAYFTQINKYPTSKEARLNKPHGAVVVRFTLTRAGEIRDVSIERASPVMLLNQQALNIVRGGSPPPMPDAAWGNASEHVFTVTLEYEPAS